MPRGVKLAMAADAGTRFDCLSMVKKPNVRHTCKAGLRAARLGVMEQMRWSSGEGWEDVAGVVFAWRCRPPGTSRTPGRTQVPLE